MPNLCLLKRLQLSVSFINGISMVPPFIVLVGMADADKVLRSVRRSDGRSSEDGWKDVIGKI